nr:hypothetical protein BaRGS_024147 [Batillaria attramentaria]
MQHPANVWYMSQAMGCAAVGLGIWALVSDDNMEALTKIDKDGKADDFNAVGLLQYAGIVVLIIIVEIVAAALAIAFKSDVEDYLQDGLKKGIGRYYDGYVNSSNPFSRAIDFAQVESCYDSIQDWVDNYAAIIIGIAFGIVAIEILAVVFACCLYRSIDD